MTEKQHGEGGYLEYVICNGTPAVIFLILKTSQSGNEWVRQELYMWCVANDNICLGACAVDVGIPMSVEVPITARCRFGIGLDH